MFNYCTANVFLMYAQDIARCKIGLKIIWADPATAPRRQSFGYRHRLQIAWCRELNSHLHVNRGINWPDSDNGLQRSTHPLGLFVFRLFYFYWWRHMENPRSTGHFGE